MDNLKLERRSTIPRRLTQVTAWTPRELPGGFQPQNRVIDKVIVALAVIGLISGFVYQVWGLLP